MKKNGNVQIRDSAETQGKLHNIEDFLKNNLPAHLGNFFDDAKSVRYQAQEVIFREGDPIEAVHFIKRGIVKFLSYLPNGRSRIVRLHARGALLDMPAQKGAAHEHTAIATSEVILYRWRTQHFNAIKEHKPDIYVRLLEQCHLSLQRADTWITHFSTGVVRARIARLLLFLAEIEHYGENEIKLLSSEEMASILGVTAESISRVIAELKRQKILERQPDQHDMYCLDRATLENIAEEIS